MSENGRHAPFTYPACDRADMADYQRRIADRAVARRAAMSASANDNKERDARFRLFETIAWIAILTCGAALLAILGAVWVFG